MSTMSWRWPQRGPRIKRVFTNCHAEPVSTSPETLKLTLKRVQGDKKESFLVIKVFKEEK